MPGFTFPRAGSLGLGSPPSRPALSMHPGHRYYVQLRLPHAHLGPLRVSLAHRYLACPLSLCPRSCGLAGRAGAYWPAPGLLVSRYPLSSGILLARRLMALPSSRAAPMDACPARGPRWCREGIAIAPSRPLPSEHLDAVGFHPPPRAYPTVHHYLRFRGSVTRPAPSLHPASHPPLLGRTQVRYRPAG